MILAFVHIWFLCLTFSRSASAAQKVGCLLFMLGFHLKSKMFAYVDQEIKGVDNLLKSAWLCHSNEYTGKS